MLSLFLDTLCWGRNPNLLNLRISPVQSKIAPLISLTLNSQRRSSTVRFRSLIATLKLHSGLGMAPVGISRQCARLSYVAIIRLACGSTPRAIASACAFRLLRRSTAQASSVLLMFPLHAVRYRKFSPSFSLAELCSHTFANSKISAKNKFCKKFFSLVERTGVSWIIAGSQPSTGLLAIGVHFVTRPAKSAEPLIQG